MQSRVEQPGRFFVPSFSFIFGLLDPQSSRGEASQIMNRSTRSSNGASGRIRFPRTDRAGPAFSNLSQALLVALVTFTLAAVIAFGAVIASNTSRTRAAVKRIPDTDVFGNSALSVGETPGYSVVHKFGLNPSIGTVSETVWFLGGLYTFLSAGERLSVVSASAADDSAGGTGARAIVISGVGADGFALSETVNMDGTTPVLTTGSFLRVNRVRVTTSGSGNTNAGIITITSVDTVTVQASVAAGVSTTQLGFFSTPSDQRAFINSIQMTAESAAGTGRQHVQGFLHTEEGTVVLIGDWGMRGGGTTSFEQPIGLPLVLPPSSTIEFRATSTTAGARISVFFIILIEDI